MGTDKAKVKKSVMAAKRVMSFLASNTKLAMSWEQDHGVREQQTIIGEVRKIIEDAMGTEPPPATLEARLEEMGRQFGFEEVMVITAARWFKTYGDTARSVGPPYHRQAECGCDGGCDWCGGTMQITHQVASAKQAWETLKRVSLSDHEGADEDSLMSEGGFTNTVRVLSVLELVRDLGIVRVEIPIKANGTIKAQFAYDLKDSEVECE